ncbi:hypothetical protein PTKIN_Ptkin13bG0301100 [Pterospermum kingtungense]
MRGSDSAKQIADHEDLLADILVKLPAKSLIKFKVVCKKWKCLISSSRFCLYHTQSFRIKCTLKPSALFIDIDFKLLPLTHDCVRLPPFDFIDLPDVMVLQSCAGLLLCVSISPSIKFFICNPTTRRMKMLSFPSYSGVEEYERFDVNLAFDKSFRYKIVVVRQLKIIKPPIMSIDIYSSETDSWSVSKIRFTCNWSRHVQYDHGVFIKGAIYWPSGFRESQYFDVENECLKTMPMPTLENAEGTVLCQYFGDCGGYLNLAIVHWPYPQFKCSVFEMLEEHSNWYMKYRLNQDIVSEVYRGLYPHKLFCSIQSMEDGDTLFVVFEDGKRVSYNFKDGTLKRLNSLMVERNKVWLESDCCFWCRIPQYIETLDCV